MNKNILIIFLSIILATKASANVVWPALIAENKINSIPIIIFSLVVEFFVIRYLLKSNNLESAKYTLLANIVSGVFGLFLRPLSGIAWELTGGFFANDFTKMGTFNPITWSSVIFIGSAINAWLELLTIRLFWKHKFTKRHYLILWLANMITVFIAVLWVAINREYKPTWLDIFSRS
jgi:hypothetical protein